MRKLKLYEIPKGFVEIPGFDGFYLANKLGEIYSRFRGRCLTETNNKFGYKTVFIKYGEKHGTYTIHRLIAKTFISNPINKRCINHINGIKNDNRVENLEWVTDSENVLHAYKTGLKKALPFYNHKISKIIADEIRLKRNLGAKLRELAEEYAMSSANISYISRGLIWV